MEETILFPSPNWFQVSGLAVSKDGWLVYGGPCRSLCVLEPLPQNKGVIAGDQRYKAQVLNRAHHEKIVSVDISLEWPEKRCFLTGSADGSVKQWIVEEANNTLRIKSTHSHEIHNHEKEDIAGVGYSNITFAITVGGFGNIVKWDLNSNVVKTYSQFLKNFKPVCMACSRHMPLHVAIGTKQGVIFVLDLNGPGKIVYKVRGQDEEIINVSWCPEYDVVVKKSLKESDKRPSVSDRMERIRNECEPNNVLDASGVIKTLPEDSFDQTVVVEDDMFDIYKDHEADEFGHKKYQPEDILVKVKQNAEKVDYLDECMKLKEDILKRKNQPVPSIESLVDALDKTHVEESTSQNEVKQVGISQSGSIAVGKSQNEVKEEYSSHNESEVVDTTHNESKVDNTKDLSIDSTKHLHKHLLATIGKYGGVRIWSKAGKLVASCAVPTNSGKNQRNKVPNWPTLLWYKPDVLLIADGKSQLLECNPLKIDCKNKLDWRIIHSLHKRGLYCIASGAPRVQFSDNPNTSNRNVDWSVWTVSQDRNIIRYSMTKHQKLAVLATCGGYLYTVQPCPYDAAKVAVSVGDGAVRVWETSTIDEDDTKLSPGHMSIYWQKVQGKVLTCAWHPTKDNLLAFSTAESRVGLIDTSGKSEKAARVLLPALTGGVYSLCWGEKYDLYACGGGDLVRYHTDKPDEGPEAVRVELEGQRWEVSAVRWGPRGLACGSHAGAVAVLAERAPHHLHAAAFLYSKMIHTIDWHPQETSSSSEESQYKNLIAVCSLDKQNTIVILEYGDKEDGGKQLVTWKTLSGHKGTVLQVAWSPHRDGQLLSTSQDTTVRVWDAASGACTSIFGGHANASFGGAWSAFPQLGDSVLSAGADFCLRLWDTKDHRADAYDDTKTETVAKKQKKKNKKEVEKKTEEATEETQEPPVEESNNVAASLDTKIKASKKFLLPIISKQMALRKVNGARRMLNNYLNKNQPAGATNGEVTEEESGLDYLKMFGNINEVNEILDMEMERHLEVNNTEAWMMLSIFRGHIDAMIQYASQKDLLCPYLISVTPCVSFKYWKDATQLYLAQIDRLVAKGEEEKLCDNRHYGGPVYRKAAVLLSIHDIKGAVAALIEARLYKEAYILCRIRYMDSIAEQTLQEWANDCVYTGNLTMAAVCYLALGNLSQAATVLGKTNDQECLSLAADLAKASGQTTFADHIEKRAQLQNTQVTDKTEEILEQLPSRIELLMKEGDKDQNEPSNDNIPLDGSGDTLVKE